MAPETWSNNTVKQVKAFIDTYEMKNPKDQGQFMCKAKALGDSYTNRREGWHKFVKITKKQVKVDNMVDRMLDDHGITLDSLVEQRGMGAISDLLPSQLDVISMAHTITFSEDIFGPQSFVHWTFAATWERYRSELWRDMRWFEELKEKCKMSMEEIKSGKMSPMLVALKKVLKDITDLIPIMTQYKAVEVAKVQGILQQLISDMSPNSEDDNEQVKLDFDVAPDIEWRTSTEEYEHLTLEQVVVVLGLPDGHIPFLNKKEDPDSCDPWLKEGKHQHISMLKMMHSALNGKPMLLMDEAGVGKSLQAIMFAMLRVYYHKYYKQYNKFPRAFGNQKYMKNLEDTFTIIIFPSNLVNQWTGEIKQYLKHSEFDLIPYMGPQGSREMFWVELQAQYKHDACHCIFLMTHTAIKANLEVCFNVLNPYVPKITSRVFARHLAN
ncbi:hypothetical protein WOLCODRAFT_156114 [Wolfiporia cocos MD-104 SS10]|uniref:SNF2 N-terminal domain-containing protein n=1 Tax=Wolfiporia cocos (strain MD-104) TaxID=742152 RepID=A0A2H3J0E1_WOLCO|nr:hypothetical protein WOLCODRAFT_156114 [Wolfiporia cocos MD-104 SS10]